MSEQFPGHSGEEQELRRERAQAFMDTHVYSENSPMEYVLGEVGKWAETDKARPFWLRTDADEEGEVRVDYVFPYGPTNEGDGIMFISFGRIDVSDQAVRAMLANPDTVGQIRSEVTAFEAEPSLDAIADALDVVEGSFAQRIADREALQDLDWDPDKEN